MAHTRDRFHPSPRSLGKELAFEALRAAIESTFSCFPLPEILADVDPRNIASLHLLRRLGFEKTGQASRTWFVNDEWADSHYLALSRDRWSA